MPERSIRELASGKTHLKPRLNGTDDVGASLIYAHVILGGTSAQFSTFFVDIASDILNHFAPSF